MSFSKAFKAAFTLSFLVVTLHAANIWTEVFSDLDHWYDSGIYLQSSGGNCGSTLGKCAKIYNNKYIIRGALTVDYKNLKLKYRVNPVVDSGDYCSVEYSTDGILTEYINLKKHYRSEGETTRTVSIPVAENTKLIFIKFTSTDNSCFFSDVFLQGTLSTLPVPTGQVEIWKDSLDYSNINSQWSTSGSAQFTTTPMKCIKRDDDNDHCIYVHPPGAAWREDTFGYHKELYLEYFVNQFGTEKGETCQIFISTQEGFPASSYSLLTQTTSSGDDEWRYESIALPIVGTDKLGLKLTVEAGNSNDNCFFSSFRLVGIPSTKPATTTPQITISGCSGVIKNYADIYFIIDASGSMAKADDTQYRYYWTHKWVSDVLDPKNSYLPKHSRVGILEFGEELQPFQMLTSADNDTFVQYAGQPVTLQWLIWNRWKNHEYSRMGYTNSFDAINYAINHLQENKISWRDQVLIFLTDGEPCLSSYCGFTICDPDDNDFQQAYLGQYIDDPTMFELERRISDIGAEAFVVGVGPDWNTLKDLVSCVATRPENILVHNSGDYGNLTQFLTVSRYTCPPTLSTDTPTKSTNTPTTTPTKKPTTSPSKYPSTYPSKSPSKKPTNDPTETPTKKPSASPSRTPSKKPTMHPSKFPSVYPSKIPTSFPSKYPSNFPSNYPSKFPSNFPSKYPSRFPSKFPSNFPSITPTIETNRPTRSSNSPTEVTSSPTRFPTKTTSFPTVVPSNSPVKTAHPTKSPTESTSTPSNFPSKKTSEPSLYPSEFPSFYPSAFPSAFPSKHPSKFPSLFPSNYPSSTPSLYPSRAPSLFPSNYPSSTPSKFPSNFPSNYPSNFPSNFPSAFPSIYPSNYPSKFPSKFPSETPSLYPSAFPSTTPTDSPSQPPSFFPSNFPTTFPTIGKPKGCIIGWAFRPPKCYIGCIGTNVSCQAYAAQQTIIKNFIYKCSRDEGDMYCAVPDIPTQSPTIAPSTATLFPTLGTAYPSNFPTVKTGNPTFSTSKPSNFPSTHPSFNPSIHPSTFPSHFPSTHPSQLPSFQPSEVPSFSPSQFPSEIPSLFPSSHPTDAPSNGPTKSTIEPTFVPTELTDVNQGGTGRASANNPFSKEFQEENPGVFWAVVAAIILIGIVLLALLIFCIIKKTRKEPEVDPFEEMVRVANANKGTNLQTGEEQSDFLSKKARAAGFGGAAKPLKNPSQIQTFEIQSAMPSAVGTADKNLFGTPKIPKKSPVPDHDDDHIQSNPMFSSYQSKALKGSDNDESSDY